MISIIICSRSKSALDDAISSIEKTIGVPYEIVAIDNSRGEYSIFQAYNAGIDRSKYNMLCFMHEDVTFETINWGKKVLGIFDSNNRLGLLGVAGSSYKSAVPSGWVFETNSDKIVSINIIQHEKIKKSSSHLLNNPHNTALADVASVDGLWFCTPKNIAEEIRFDEVTFNNFHCYDVDYSLAVLQRYKVAVTFDILINHFSAGNLNDSWLTETLKLHKKWRKILPINLIDLSGIESKQLEFEAFHAVLPKLKGKREISFEFMRTLWNSRALSLVGLKKFSVMIIIVLKKGFE
jgi:hypothetical protein